MPPSGQARACFEAERIEHWNSVANWLETSRGLGGAYHKRLASVYRSLIGPGARILELGCGRGDLLASLEPSLGTGVDFAPAMVAAARHRHPGLEIIEADAQGFAAEDRTYDAFILSDLVNDLWDVQAVFENLAAVARPHTRIVINSYSKLWEFPLAIAEGLGLAKPNLGQNWLTPRDLHGLLELAGFRVIRSWQEVLFPLPLPGVEHFLNRFLAKLWPFRHLCLSNFIVAQKAGELRRTAPSVSVIVPARNEAGNIKAIFDRTPEMGAGTELIFVEGGSRDDTWEVIEREIAANPSRRARLLRQPGKGKGDAVRHGFAAANGDILMILDADLTVPPEDLTRFFRVLAEGKGEFVNGVRLVYPMEERAMRLLNLLGNKFFSFVFSWLLGQPIRDTLCGTKVLWKPDYDRIAANRKYFGDFDPFGDFDLIFGAARLNLVISEIPVRYRERTYGTTNIERWKHGWLLLRMVLFAASRIKFV